MSNDKLTDPKFDEPTKTIPMVSTTPISKPPKKSDKSSKQNQASNEPVTKRTRTNWEKRYKETHELYLKTSEALAEAYKELESKREHVYLVENDNYDLSNTLQNLTNEHTKLLEAVVNYTQILDNASTLIKYNLTEILKREKNRTSGLDKSPTLGGSKR